MKTVKVTDLVLGDTIKLWDGDYGCATVYRITDVGVHVWRPYIRTSEFSYGGAADRRVVPHIGIEDFPLDRGNTSATFHVVRSDVVKPPKGE
jgi:hypothetical protein